MAKTTSRKSSTTNKKSAATSARSGSSKSAKSSSNARAQGARSAQGAKKSATRNAQNARTSQGSKKSAGSAQERGPVSDSMLQEFFVDELKDIYWAEQKLVKTLPKLQKAATSEELQEAFANHLEETKGQVQRLEQVFQLLGERAQAKKCDAMEGITEEGSSVIEDTEVGTATRDVALVMAGQKAEHYEIATYGGLVQIARTLGLDQAADLLEETLEEEKNCDALLTQIAEGGINYEASAEGEEGEEDQEDEEEDEEEA